MADGILVIEEWRRERRIRRVLRAVARQRVGLIVQPGNVWVMERAVSEDDEGTAEALRTCHMRGWVEMISEGVPQARLEQGGQISQALQRRAPLYRLTDSGWNQIRRTHAWLVATCLIAVITLIVAIVTLLFTPAFLQQVREMFRGHPG